MLPPPAPTGARARPRPRRPAPACRTRGGLCLLHLLLLRRRGSPMMAPCVPCE
jgi:hypothetical protein